MQRAAQAVQHGRKLEEFLVGTKELQDDRASSYRDEQKAREIKIEEQQLEISREKLQVEKERGEKVSALRRDVASCVMAVDRLRRACESTFLLVRTCGRGVALLQIRAVKWSCHALLCSSLLVIHCLRSLTL